MALQNDVNQGDNLESNPIEKTTGIVGAQDLSNVKPVEEVKNKELEAKIKAQIADFSPAKVDPPVKILPPEYSGGSSASTPTTQEVVDKYGKIPYNPNRVITPPSSETAPEHPQPSFLDTMVKVGQGDTSIVRPIDQSINYDEYKDYLSKNHSYFDAETGLDKLRAQNQGTGEQFMNAGLRILANVIPEGIKQVANAFDLDHLNAAEDGIGNVVADYMTEIQENVKEALPIYRENPNEALDVTDPAYIASTLESLVTSIGGFVLAGYATGGVASGVGKVLGGATELASTINIGKKVAEGIKSSSSFQKALVAAKGAGLGTKAESLAVNFLLNQAEGRGIGAQVYADVQQREYYKAIAEGKSLDDALAISKDKAGKAGVAAINFNRITMALNVSSSDLFLQSPKNLGNLVKKESGKQLLKEGGQEAGEEYINDLAQMYGEGLDTDTPLTFKAATQRLATAEGIESPILGFIGGAGQTALTKAGKYIQSSSNESYMRHFNQYIVEHPIDGTNKETVIANATKYAQEQADKDKPLGFINRGNKSAERTSTAQQLESLYVAQQANLEDYKKATLADNMNDVVNASISSSFSVDLQAQIKNDPLMPQAQKDNLLERSLLSHQAYIALQVGTENQLKDLYRTYANMDESTAKERGIFNGEPKDDINHYKNKAERAIKSIEAFEQSFYASKGFVNSAEVYDRMNNNYFNLRDVEDLSKKHNKLLSEMNEFSRNLYEQDGDEEALKDIADREAEGKAIVHPSLWGSAMEEEFKDVQKALKIAKDTNVKNYVALKQITSSKYNTELAETIKLYRTKQQNEKRKKEGVKDSTSWWGKAFGKGKEIVKRKEEENLKPSSAKVENTNKPSTTGKSQPTPSQATVQPTSTQAAPTTQNNYTPPPVIDTTKPNNSVNDVNNQPELFSFKVEYPSASEVMKQFLASDNKKINEIVSSRLSLDSKISKLQEMVNERIDYTLEAVTSLAPDGEAVMLKIINGIENKIKELEAYKETFSPDIIDEQQAYEGDVVDFALDLEEEQLGAEANQPDGETKSLDVITSQFTIYSAILDQMARRGIDTTSLIDVMTEFKTILGTRLLKSEFNSLQGLFNFANNTNESSTYADLFNSDKDNENDLDNYNKIALVSKQTGQFVYDVDKESQMAMQTTKQGIIMNNPNAEVKGIAYTHYNETGADKLAYLAQQYSISVEQKTNEEGLNYVELDKDTVENTINSALDPKVLEEDYFKEGDEITFIPLDSFTDEDGNLVLADDLPIGEKPIGVIKNGELVKGLYLHTTKWITAENIKNTPSNIEYDRQNLLNLRTRIINGEQITTKINEVSEGAPITGVKGEMYTFANEFPEYPVGIVRNGQIETKGGNIIEYPEFLHFDDGDVVSVVNGYYYYGSRTNLFPPMIAAIKSALTAYATATHTEGTQLLLNTTGNDILKPKGIETYLRDFIYTNTIRIDDFYPTNLEEFKQILQTIGEDRVIVNFIDGNFYIGRGGAIDVYTIKAGEYKNNPEYLEQYLSAIGEVLQDAYANVNLQSLENNAPLHIINDEGISKTFNTYEDYIKQVSVSPYVSITLPSGNKITTIQKRVSFDIPGIADNSNNVGKTTTKKGVPRKPRVKKQTIKTEAGKDQVIEITSLDTENPVIDTENFTEDFNPLVEDAPIVSESEVQYTLKAINILNSAKAKQVFEKGNKNNWSLDKILTELQIPKEQKQLILDLGITDKEQIVLELASKYSYSVEINIATDKNRSYYERDGKYYFSDPIDGGIPVTKEEYEKQTYNTQHYSNLTVPGGTNYTENEISTPLITPSIKGHAQFSTDNGIGWFRSDDKARVVPKSEAIEDRPNSWGSVSYGVTKDEAIISTVGDKIVYALPDNKTRRILEVQSDLFQKGRKEGRALAYNRYLLDSKGDVIGENPKFQSEQDFLNLLGKDNNWVTFFVKSIIQDSAKKGYEKVLFPSGNTASKVEGHTTLEEFKKQKEDRIKSLQEAVIVKQDKEVWNEELGVNEIFPYIVKFNDRGTKFELPYKTKEEAQKLIDSKETEITQLKQELERVEGPEGFGALKPIYNFYENTVTNILKKQGYKPVEITDEYGNTWNEVIIENVDTTVDLSPDVQDDPLASPSYIAGLPLPLQEAIVNDVVQEYYNLMLSNRGTDNKQATVEQFFDAKIAFYNDVLIAFNNANSPHYDKLAQQVETIIKSKDQFIKIIKQTLTSQLKVKVTDDKVELPNSDDEVNDTIENVDAPDGGDSEDVQEDSRIYTKNEFSIDPKTQLSFEIKALLYGIIDANLVYKNGVPAIEPRKFALQVPVYVNPNAVYQDLMMLFSKSSTNDGMDTTQFNVDENSPLLPKIQVAIQILESQYTIKPYYANVVKKLKELDEKTQIQFITTFNKNNTDHSKIIEYVDRNGEGISLRVIRNSNQNAQDQLISTWSESLKAIGGYRPGADTVELADEIYIGFTNAYKQMAGNTALHTYDHFKVLFSILGIHLPENAFNKLREGTYVNGKIKTLTQQFEHKEGWFKRINERVTFIKGSKTDSKNPPKDANTLFNTDVFKEFADFLLKFDKSVFNTSYKNGNGDTIYGVTNNRYFMERFIGLKHNSKLLKQLAKNPFSSKSDWVAKLLNIDNGTINKNQFHSTFSYNTVDSYTINANNKTKMVDKLNRKELIQLSLSYFYNSGEGIFNNKVPIHTFIIPALSDKSNMFTIKTVGRFYNRTNGRLSDDDLTYLRTQLFEGEFHRIVHHSLKGKIGTKGYDDGNSKFLLFPEFNNVEGVFIDGKINPNALNPTDDFGNANPVLEAINEKINEYIDNITRDTYQDWSNLGLLKQGKTDEHLGHIYSDKMEFIDTTYAAVSKTNPKNSMQEAESAVLNYVTNYLVANANMQYTIFNDPAFYYKKPKLDEDTKAIISTDIAETWDNATKRYAAVNGGKDDFQFPAGSKFSVLSINDTKVTSNTIDYLSSLWAGHPLEQDVIKAYSSMEPGDAQEYTSLEEHLDRMVYGHMLGRPEATRILDAYNKTGKVSKKDLGTLLINFKPLYFNTFVGTKGVMETVYIKTSSFPLIKELTKGTQLDELRQYLEDSKNKVKVAVFASGIKAGNPTSSLNLFDSKGNMLPGALKGDLKPFILKDLPREGHGNQQANPDKSKSTVINDGTQQAKLIFTNILNVLGFKNPFGEGEVSGRELSTMYLNRYEQRFKSQYDKLMRELQVQNGRITNVAKLKNILVEEATTRGWTFNEASSFELDSLGLNFEIPLWMSVSSSKIENLLSAIVDNRIRKRKRFGRSFILASEAGIRTFDNRVDNNDSGIIFTDDFKGELRNSFNDNGEMTSAEILVPFRFYDNDGNLLNIKDFMIGNKLDTSKLPPNLLEGFGYRIPTSGINLMSNIKVVGFLPESYGDTVIAPADFTKQMGSDFDVDKFYSSLYATYYNKETGSLEKLTKVHEEARNKIINTIYNLRKDEKRLANYKGKKKDQLIQEVKKAIKEQEQKPLFKSKNLKNLDILVIDNELTDIQRAVLNNPSKEVQRARTKPLSFGRLEEMITKFYKGTSDKYYTFLNRSVQDVNYLNGQLGKTAVGNFSLDMILNSLGQYVTTPLFFQTSYTDANGKPRVKEVKVKAFGFKSNYINDPMLNDGSGRYKSDVLEGLMAAALDNGKEQILGKLGINDKTFDFIRAMVATGYNEEVIMGILAQPVIKAYLSPTTDAKIKSLLKSTLIKLETYDETTGYRTGATTRLGNFSLSTLAEAIEDFDSTTITTNNIKALASIDFKGTTTSKSSKELQLYALDLFLKMEKYGKALSQIRSALNVDSAGVGKNIIYSAGKLEQADAARTNKNINNPYAYFINGSINPDTNEFEKISSSIGNSALFYGANTNYQLWNRYFPFDNEVVNRILKTIADRTGKDIFRLNSYSDYATLILKDFKSFLSAKTIPTILPDFMKGMTTNEVYKYIIHSTPTHQSLGEFIFDLRNIKDEKGNVTYVNSFLNDLGIKPVDKTTTTSENNPAIVDINYISVNRVDKNENRIVNAMIEMLNNPVNLGLWNGNPITSRDLMNLLSTYQFISKGIPAPNKFIEYLPNTDLKRIGYYHQLDNTYSEFVNANLNDEFKVTEEQYLVQHLQHNMEDYYNAGKQKAYEGYFEDGLFVGEDISNVPTYIVFKDSDGYHAQYKLKNSFIRLNPLGWGSNTEYNHEVINPTSINHRNNKNMVNVKEHLIANIEIKENSNTTIVPTTTLIDSTLGKVQDLIIPFENEQGETMDGLYKAYPIVMTANGSKNSFYLVKNGTTYNTIYHPITKVVIPINGLTASTTKKERDAKIMQALSVVPANVIDALGLAEQLESFNIDSIEANIEEFMTPSRDKQKDVFPSDINASPREFADELGLSDTSLNLEDKYALIFDNIRRKIGDATPLGYFLAKAKEIIPALGNTPIVMDTTLKAQGSYKSNGATGYIVINPNKFKTVEEMAMVIAHEAIHGLFKKQILVSNPIVKQLEKLRKEVEDLLVAEYGQEAIDTMRNKINNVDAATGKRAPLALTRGVEADLLYGIFNIDEFLTAALTNPAFQTYLNSKDIKLADKSLWQKLMELLSSLLEAIGVRKDSKLADALGGIFALTDDIKKNHLKAFPKSKWARSIEFINDKFNLIDDTNNLSPKGNPEEIATFINDNFVNTTATVIDSKYVQVVPTDTSNTINFMPVVSDDEWDFESLNLEQKEREVNSEIRANYYQYAAMLRARIIEGEKALQRAKVTGDITLIEQANEKLLADKVALMNVPKLRSLSDLELKAKEDLDKVNKVLSGAMNSEDIIYARNVLNFWTNVRKYTFTPKHTESESLMRTFGIIEDDAQTAINKLALIEKSYLESFIKDMTGRELTLDDIFNDYKDVSSIKSLTRDISTYDNALLTSIWKRVQLANMQAEEEANTMLNTLDDLIIKVMPKLNSINSKTPFEIFRQLSENGKKTNHLISPYSSKFFNERSGNLYYAKEHGTADAVNRYAKWVKANTSVIDLELYFPQDDVVTPEIEANREELRTRVGDFRYNLWFNGQNRKINSYLKRREAVIAKIKDDNGLDDTSDINTIETVSKAIRNWEIKHSPYEFSTIINKSSYEYYGGLEGIDGFTHYEVLPSKPDHLNPAFEPIASDPDLMEFYTEFSSLYEKLKMYVPASQLSSLIYGGLPVLEQSIYENYSRNGLKAGFKGIKSALVKANTSSYSNKNNQELDLVTGENAKHMYVSGITSDSKFIKDYIKSESIKYEVETGKAVTDVQEDKFKEEAIHLAAQRRDFDLGKMMKLFGTLVISHKQIAQIEDLIKIGQYTLNSYKEVERNPDGTPATTVLNGISTLPNTVAFPHTKEAFAYFIDSQVYGNIKDEEGVTNTKLRTAEEDDINTSYKDTLAELEAKKANGEITDEFYESLKETITSNMKNLGSNIVGSKVADSWLKYVQLKLMGWNILGGLSNSAFGFISNMIEASGEGSFSLDDMRAAYKMTTASVAKNLTFNKWEAGESGKIRNAMDRMNVLKEASHELYTSKDATTISGKFKFASPYNMNQRTEYLNQAPIMIIMAKKTMVDTPAGRISIWEGMDKDWKWDTEKYGPIPTKVIMDMRVAITKHIQRLHGNYDPASPLLLKKKILGRAISQFRTWLYESVATRFEKERTDDAIGITVKGRYRTLGGILFENEGRLGLKEGGIEFGKALLNAVTFGKAKMKSFQNTNLSEIDAQNMRKVAMEMVLILDTYLLILLLKAGLSDDDEEAKAMYNVLLNQGTRLKSDMLLYVNPSEARNIFKDIIPSLSLYDDIAKFGTAVINIEDDEIKSGVHKGDSRLGSATMKLIPFSSKVYGTYNSMSQIFDKDISIKEEKED